MIDDCYINNLGKNQVSAVSHLRVFSRSVSHKTVRIDTNTAAVK